MLFDCALLSTILTDYLFIPLPFGFASFHVDGEDKLLALMALASFSFGDDLVASYANISIVARAD